MAGQAPVMLSSFNSCNKDRRLHHKLFLTKNQLNPSRFGNKNVTQFYSLLLFTAKEPRIRGTVTQDTT